MKKEWIKKLNLERERAEAERDAVNTHRRVEGNV